MVLRHTEHLHHVLARLGHHDAERGKQYREVGARPVYLQVLQRRSCFPIAPRGLQTTSCTSSPRLTMWSPSGKCRSSTNIWATYARFALLKAAVLARLVMMIMMVLVMMMNVQLRDPNFEAEIWPRKRRTAKAHVRSRELWLSACFRPGFQSHNEDHLHMQFLGSFSWPPT